MASALRELITGLPGQSPRGAGAESLVRAEIHSLFYTQRPDFMVTLNWSGRASVSSSYSDLEIG